MAAHCANGSSVNCGVVAWEVYPDGAVWDFPLIQRVVTLAVIIVLTLVGNSTIILVLSHHTKRPSRVNLFILHLAIGDLAVGLFTQTSEILFEIFGSWVLGAAACKVIVYGQIATLASTTFILTSMSYDRYSAICKPLEPRGSLRRAEVLLAVSWGLAFIFATPQLFIFLQVQTGVTPSGEPHFECLSSGYTRHWQRQVYFSWLTLYILVVPGLLISAFYVNVARTVWNAEKCDLRRSRFPRARIKTLKLTVAIIASFLICWIPYFVVHNVRIHSHYTVRVPKTVIVFAETLALFNSAVNPIYYGFFNVHIRRSLSDVLRRRRETGGRSNNRSSDALPVHTCSTAPTSLKERRGNSVNNHAAGCPL